MATICITGGTGMIGTALTKLLTGKGHEVIVLTRHPRPGSANVSYAHWDPAQQTVDAAAIQRADYIINLAGAGVADKRWTKKRKQELVDSRVKSGELLVKALKEMPNRVKAVVSVSGIGWYGDDEKRSDHQPFFTETDAADEGFLGQTCVQWEAAVQPVTDLNKRLVVYRCGIVLSREGGALVEYTKPVRWGMAAILGSGRQMISWIHIDDMCRLFLYALENEKMQGVYNAVAPRPVCNKDFMLMLGQKIKGRFFIPFYVPSFVLKIMLGELSIEVLKSATVSSEKISGTGFQFLYPSSDAALNNLVKP